MLLIAYNAQGTSLTSRRDFEQRGWAEKEEVDQGLAPNAKSRSHGTRPRDVIGYFYPISHQLELAHLVLLDVHRVF